MNLKLTYAVLLFVVGCSKSTGKSSSGKSSILEGTWSTDCSGDEEGSTREQHVFSDANYTATRTSYSKGNCPVGSEKSVDRLQASIVIGSAATSPEGTTKIDLSNIRIFWTLKSDEVLIQFNTNSNFGFSDWAKDKEKEVTGRDIDGVALNQNKLYSIFKLTGNTLCLGTSDGDNDGSTEEKREQILETGVDCLQR